jgi:hypothetical protein
MKIKSTVMLAATLAVGLVAVYALSSGPAVYLAERGVVSHRAIQTTYTPLLAAVDQTDAYHAYIRWWFKQSH